MTAATLIDPHTRTTRAVQIDLNDYRAIQSAIGGYLFEDHQVRRGDRMIGRLYMAENRHVLPSQESFVVEGYTVAGTDNLRVYGAALFVPNRGATPPQRLAVAYFSHEQAKTPVAPVVRTMSAKELNRVVELGAAENQNPAIIAMEGVARGWDRKRETGEKSSFMRQFGREPRPFIPREVGTFDNGRCSVSELEGAFLGFYEWNRKRGTFRHDSFIGRAFDAPPFFFPDGLDPDEEEFEAGKGVEQGTLTLPFPEAAFWIVYWDTLLLKGRGHDGPILLYVEQRDKGFVTHQSYRGRIGQYTLGSVQEHDRLRRIPSALVTALHRLNNRRHVIERGVVSPALDRVNAGRAKSKHGLTPLPGFIRVTGKVDVGRATSFGTGVERCRHERRAHWRKRRNGVELRPENWIPIRAATIRPDKEAGSRKPYLVV